MKSRRSEMKRGVALILAAMLCVGLLPTSALAEGEEAASEESIQETAEEELQVTEESENSQTEPAGDDDQNESAEDEGTEDENDIALFSAEDEDSAEDDEENIGIETLALEDLEPYPDYPNVGEPSIGDLKWGVTHSKEATNLEENPDTGNLESTVTLRVSHDVDVVIVQDGTNLVNATDDFIKDLANQTDVHINCGMVIFGGTAPICWTSDDLLDLSVGANVEYLIEGLEKDAWEPDVLWNHSGSNLQAGLREAERMLEEDEKLTSSDKYIVFMSDCAARMWLNDDDEVMAKSYMIGNSQWFFDGTEDWIQRYGRWTDARFDRNSDPSPDKILYAYPHTFQEVWNAGQAGASIDDYTMTFEQWQAAKEAGSLEGSVRITDAGDAPHSNTMEEYYASYEAATYHTAEEFVKAAGMANIELVTFSYQGYPLIQYNFGEYINSFQGWLGDLNNITRYEYLESDDEGQTENESYIFEHILDQIKSTEVGQGVLIDEIGDTYYYDEDGNKIDYNFDFVDEIDRLHLIAGKDEYTCTQIEATDGATSAYGFGDANGSDDGTTYPFILRYYKDGYTYTDPYYGTTTTYGECFALEFNTSISGFYEYDDSLGVLYNGVSFTYDIYLTNPQTETGVYGEYDQYGENDTGGLYTNNIAVMYPQSPSGTAEPSQEFPMPTVSYRSLEVEKEWEDEDNANGTRPGEIEVELLKNGEETEKTVTLSEDNDWKGGFAGLELGPDGNEVASVTVTEGEDWSWVFDSLDKYYADGTEIEYTYVEEPVDGYNTTVDNETGTVTNTESVDLSGSVIWEDDDDAAGARPDSVTLHICANGVRVRRIVVTADDDWHWSCDSLDKYDEDGEEIAYTVTEDAVKGYTSEVDGYNATNIYKSDQTNATTTSTNDVMLLAITTEDISGSINWYDDDNADGNRPESVTVTLYKNGAPVYDSTGDPVTTTTSANEDWAFDFGGGWDPLDQDEDNYYSVAVSTPDGYSITAEYSTFEIPIIGTTRYLTCTVTYIASTDISGSVTWLDNKNENKTRPEDGITVYLYANGVQVTDESGEPVSANANESNGWTWNFEDVDKYSINSIKITYTIAIDDTGLGDYNVTVNGYSNVTCVESTSKDGSKKWNDGENADGTRPDEIIIHIYEGKAPITYSVKEVSVDGYTSAVTGNQAVGFVITNRQPAIAKEELEDDYERKDKDIEHDDNHGHFEENVDGDGWGSWDDADNNQEITYHLTISNIKDMTNITVHDYLEDGLDFEPDTVSVELIDGDNTRTLSLGTDYTETETTTCSDPNGCAMDGCTFEVHFDDEVFQDVSYDSYLVIAYNALTDTREDDYIDYEDDVLNHSYMTYGVSSYRSTIVTTETDLFGFGVYKYTVENGEQVPLSGAKFVLKKNGQYATFESKTDEYNVDYYLVTGWTEDEDSAGTLISGEDGMIRIEGLDDDSYTLTETAAPTGYELLDDPDIAVVIDETGAVTFNGDENAVEKDTALVHQADVKNDLILIDIEVDKEWDDNDNQDGERPDEITVRLYANGKPAVDENGDEIIATITPDENGNWVYKFTDLPEYENGEKITYVVIEESVEDYTTSYEQQDTIEYPDGNDVESWKITNKHTPDETGLYVYKLWTDGSNQDGIRPDSITIRLLADGQPALNAAGEEYILILSEENGWSGNFTGLPVYHDHGEEITYTISEDDIEGYEANIVQVDNTDVVIIDNTHQTETVNVAGSKTWEDEDNQDGTRPDYITIRLYADDEEVDHVNVTKDDGWNWSFTDLPKYKQVENDEGEVTTHEIVYTIAEDDVDGYESAIDGYDVINSHTPVEPEPEPTETRDISGSKTWDDDNDKADARPDYIIVNLYRSDAPEEVYRSKTVTADDGWSWSWTNLPKTDENGEDYVYTIDEDEVEYYTPTYYTDGDFNIKNTFVGEEGAEHPTSGPEKGGDTPKTGDTSNIGLWLALLVAAMAAVFAVIRMRKRSGAH